MSSKVVISQIVLRLSLIIILPLAVQHSLNLFAFLSFRIFERKFGAPWCEVFEEDAVFGRASFIEVFESAPCTIQIISTALTAETNNGDYRLCLAVDWAESAVSFHVIRAIGRVMCINFVLFTISISFAFTFTPSKYSLIPWMLRFGRFEYCCIESSSSSRVSSLFSRRTILSFLSDNCAVKLANY